MHDAQPVESDELVGLQLKAVTNNPLVTHMRSVYIIYLQGYTHFAVQLIWVNTTTNELKLKVSRIIGS